MALSFFLHHYLHYLQVKRCGMIWKGFKKYIYQIPSFLIETPGNRDSIAKQFCALYHWKELWAVQFEQCWGNMQFEISVECMLIHTICCSWSAPYAITWPVANDACWIHVVTFTSDQPKGNTLVSAKHTLSSFTLNVPNSWILASRLVALLIVWTIYSLALGKVFCLTLLKDLTFMC